MFDLGSTSHVGSVADLRSLREAVACLDGAAVSDAERIDLLRELESLKSAAAAAQARVTSAFDASQRERAPELKPTAEVSAGIAAQIALARRDARARGQRHLGVALALAREMPCTLSALTSGEISEWRATQVVQATACLSRSDREAVDCELSGRLAGQGDRAVANLARAAADRRDPGAAWRRIRKADSDRRVSVRPAADSMCYLTALVPVALGVGAYARLHRQAVALKTAGDPRTLDQIRADTLVESIAGAEGAVRDAGQSEAPGVRSVEVRLVMHQRTLFGGSHDPAHLEGYGAVPATLARKVVREADRVWLRRLFADPTSGELVALESRSRTFDHGLRDLVITRDRVCRTPWCDAPVRHVDHVVDHAAGGATSADNGQGLCEACNYAKSGRGWRADFTDGRGHCVRLVTPTGHVYESRPPAQPGAGPPGSPEHALRRVVDDHDAA